MRQSRDQNGLHVSYTMLFPPQKGPFGLGPSTLKSPHGSVWGFKSSPPAPPLLASGWVSVLKSSPHPSTSFELPQMIIISFFNVPPSYGLCLFFYTYICVWNNSSVWITVTFWGDWQQVKTCFNLLNNPGKWMLTMLQKNNWRLGCRSCLAMVAQLVRSMRWNLAFYPT